MSEFKVGDRIVILDNEVEYRQCCKNKVGKNGTISKIEITGDSSLQTKLFIKFDEDINNDCNVFFPHHLKKLEEPKFKIGDRVKHERFGKGIIVAKHQDDLFVVKFDKKHPYLHDGSWCGSCCDNNICYPDQCWFCDDDDLKKLKKKIKEFKVGSRVISKQSKWKGTIVEKIKNGYQIKCDNGELIGIYSWHRDTEKIMRENYNLLRKKKVEFNKGDRIKHSKYGKGTVSSILNNPVYFERKGIFLYVTFDEPTAFKTFLVNDFECKKFRKKQIEFKVGDRVKDKKVNKKGIIIEIIDNDLSMILFDNKYLGSHIWSSPNYRLKKLKKKTLKTEDAVKNLHDYYMQYIDKPSLFNSNFTRNTEPIKIEDAANESNFQFACLMDSFAKSTESFTKHSIDFDFGKIILKQKIENLQRIIDLNFKSYHKHLEEQFKLKQELEKYK